MKKGLEYMALEEADRIWTINKVQEIRDSSLALAIVGKGDQGNLLVNNKVVRANSSLGSGGTKEVYDVEIDGKQYALAIPGTNKHDSRVYKNWCEALYEPKNTKKLRNYGLNVNFLSEVVDVKVDDISFPGILMGRYQDQPYEVFDSKNSVNNRNHLVGKDTKIDGAKFLEMFGDVSSDVACLIRSGIGVVSDSINYCQGDNSRGLYFNDLGNAKFESYDQTESVVEWYVLRAFDAVMASFGGTYFENDSLMALDNNTVRSDILDSLKERVQTAL